MMLAAKLGDIEMDLLTVADRIFNYIYNLSVSLFTTNPRDWAESLGIWSVINQIYENIIPIGCSLVVVIFLIGFCSNTIDVKEELNFEKAIRLLIRLGITEWFVVNSLTITGYLFSMVSGLIGLVNNTTTTPAITSPVSTYLYEMSNTSRVVLLFVVIFYLVILPVSAAAIMVMALIRLFKVMLIIPYGPIAYSTIAGGIQAISGTLPSYIKYLLGTLLEAFSVMVALKIGQVMILNKSLFDLTSIPSSDYLMPCVLELCQTMISAVLLTILVKIAKDVATKALGLIQ